MKAEVKTQVVEVQLTLTPTEAAILKGLAGAIFGYGQGSSPKIDIKSLGYPESELKALMVEVYDRLKGVGV